MDFQSIVVELRELYSFLKKHRKVRKKLQAKLLNEAKKLSSVQV